MGLNLKLNLLGLQNKPKNTEVHKICGVVIITKKIQSSTSQKTSFRM